MGQVDSQTAHLADGATVEVTEEAEQLEFKKTMTVTLRLPPDGKRTVTKTFEMRTVGPNDRRAIAHTAMGITGAAAWSALPSDYRAWVTAIARIGVMFKGQPDYDWLIVRCERNPVMLDKVDAEVELHWAESFPEAYVVGEGEEGEVVAAVAVTSGGPRPAAVGPARPPARRAGVAPAR